MSSGPNRYLQTLNSLQLSSPQHFLQNSPPKNLNKYRETEIIPRFNKAQISSKIISLKLYQFLGIKQHTT